MSVTVTIETIDANGTDVTAIQVTDEALARARRKFNPSGDRRVDALKVLAAAIYTELDDISRNAGSSGGGATAQGEAATAATFIQAGAMFAVSAATAHLG